MYKGGSFILLTWSGSFSVESRVATVQDTPTHLQHHVTGFLWLCLVSLLSEGVDTEPLGVRMEKLRMDGTYTDALNQQTSQRES